MILFQLKKNPYFGSFPLPGYWALIGSF